VMRETHRPKACRSQRHSKAIPARAVATQVLPSLYSQRATMVSTLILCEQLFADLGREILGTSLGAEDDVDEDRRGIAEQPTIAPFNTRPAGPT
jgi:hypothetical protein